LREPIVGFRHARVMPPFSRYTAIMLFAPTYFTCFRRATLSQHFADLTRRPPPPCFALLFMVMPIFCSFARLSLYLSPRDMLILFSPDVSPRLTFSMHVFTPRYIPCRLLLMFASHVDFAVKVVYGATDDFPLFHARFSLVFDYARRLAAPADLQRTPYAMSPTPCRRFNAVPMKRLPTMPAQPQCLYCAPAAVREAISLIISSRSRLFIFRDFHCASPKAQRSRWR
jgi:hypothetical protein